MTESVSRYLKGHMLMAMPGLADPNFSHTVTCIVEHNQAGAVGVVVNRIHPFITAKDIFRELKMTYAPEAEDIPIFVGGPVHEGEVFILHGPPFHWLGCLEVTPGLALSNTKDALEAIAAGQMRKSFILALGCAGWGEDQLESEIMQNVWLTSPIAENLIFEVPVEARWETALKAMGVDPLLLSDEAGRA